MTCTTCEQYRKEMGEAMSQGAMIKAALIAMHGAAHMVKQAAGSNDDAESSAKTGK